MPWTMRFISASEICILFYQVGRTLFSENRVNLSSESDVSPDLVLSECVNEGVLLVFMQAKYVLYDISIYFRLTFVHYNEKEVEAWHDWLRQANISSKAFIWLIFTHVRGDCSKNWGSCIESCLNTSFGDRYCLLLHSFVDCSEVFWVHCIKLINTAYTIISKHHSSCFDTKLSSIRIALDRCC